MPTILNEEQFKQRYGLVGLSKFNPTQQPQQQSRFQETFEDVKQTGSNILDRFKTGFKSLKGLEESDTGFLSRQVQSAGIAAGTLSQSIGDLFTGAVKGVLSQDQENTVKNKVSEVTTSILQNPEVSQGIKTSVDAFQKLDPNTQKNLESLFNISMLGLDVAGINVAGKGIKTGAKLGKEAVEEGIERGIKLGKQTAVRTFDTLKSVPERISNVRASIGRTGKEVIEEVGEKTVKTGVRFTDNPNITGALDDIKVMVGLPESTPSVDLTFRAIKPRLSKTTNLRRIKSQMELANQSIVQNGFKPTNVREYADAVFQTKKKVWSQIQSKLDEGQLAGQEIDLTDIAVKILDRASDPALLRTNPRAAKQLVKIAEDLVSQGDTTDILTAERIKQFLNAELGDAFGTTDLSQQAKEAKKLITKEIGNQLDNKLADLPDDFRNLKIEYGSLSSIEDDILKRAIVFERANPEGLADILSKTEAAVEIAFGGAKGRIKGITRLTIAKKLKEANDVNKLIQRAFESLTSNLK